MEEEKRKLAILKEQEAGAVKLLALLWKGRIEAGREGLQALFYRGRLRKLAATIRQSRQEQYALERGPLQTEWLH